MNPKTPSSKIQTNIHYFEEYKSNSKLRQIKFVYYFSLVGMTTLALFGVVSLVEQRTELGVAELSFAVIGILNLLYLRLSNNSSVASSIVLLIMLATILVLLVTGGIGGTGAYWAFVFPILAFFMKGRSGGITWTAAFLIIMALLLLTNELDIIDVQYSVLELRQLLAAIAVCSFMVYLYQNDSEYSHDLLAKSSQQSVINVKQLLQEVERRQASENLVNSSYIEMKEQNDLLQKTKLAVLNILEDLEDAKVKVSSEKEKVDTIIQSIGDGVFVVDANHRIVLLNPVAANLTGCTIEQALGKPYTDVMKFIHEDSGLASNSFITECFKTGEVQEMSDRTMLISLDGRKVPVSDSAAPIKNTNGVVVGCVVVFRDVTKDRDVDRAKTEFVSLASHQLRTPLSAINWYSEMLLNGDAGELNPEQKTFMIEVHDSNQRMIDLVNSLLNVSRIDLGTFEITPEPIDIRAVADSVLKELEQLTTRKQQVVEKIYAADVPLVDLDSKLIRIVVQNLLSNAAKYSPEKGKITIDISKDDTNLNMKVADNGFGIPKAQQEKIFQKLFRADNAIEHEADGNGLGLYIVKAVIDQGGGKIWFESEEGKGTTFYIQLPLGGMKAKKGSRVLS